MMTMPTPVQEPSVDDAADAAPAHTVEAGSDGAGAKVLAKPPVRKLAKDLGVDLTTVTPSGDGGVVTRSDVESAAAGNGTTASAAPAYTPAPGQRETRVPVKGVRKMTAQAMVTSAFTAPHVTEWVTIDVTRTMDLVARLKKDRDFRDVKVSPLLLVAKALILAVKRNPDINAVWDEAAQEIVVKHYVNLGIAAATPRGLVVPNIKDADRMSLRELAEALQSLTATAREGRTQPAEMSGGTMTITNVGVFGVDAGTPILNPGEAAILCFGQVRDLPWVVDGEIAVRQGHPARAVLRPPGRRRPARLDVPRRHRPRPRGPRHRPPLVAPRPLPVDHVNVIDGHYARRARHAQEPYAVRSGSRTGEGQGGVASATRAPSSR